MFLRVISSITLASGDAGVLEDWFEVDDGGAVDGFEGFDLQVAVLVYGEDFAAVQADWVGPIRRAGGKDSLEGVEAVASRMHFQGGALGLMEPGEDPDFVTGLEAFECLEKGWEDLKLRVGRALPSLMRSVGALFQD